MGFEKRDPRTVLGIVGEPATGVSYARFFQPFAHLNGLGYRLAHLGESLPLIQTASGYAPAESLYRDVSMVIFPQMVASPRLGDGSRLNLVEPVCEHARRNGLKIVYSVDDWLDAIEEHNPQYEKVSGSIGNLGTIRDRADAMLVTTPELERKLSPLGKPVHVLPNAIDPARWKTRPGNSGELRIGWSGSSSHIQDLLMVLPGIRRLQRRVPFRFVLYGLVDRPLDREAQQVRRILGNLSPSERVTADSFLELSGMLEDVVHEHVPFTGVNRFFDTLPGLDLDVGICPLLDTEFNRHKSALKFYEYAMCGTMTVASNVVPYSNEVTVTVLNEPDAWRDVLEHYLKDDGEREMELEEQRELVLETRNIEKLKYRWAEALDRILDREEVASCQPAEAR
jgi:glycosyltransferase involved in cell wall biosynthesis